MPINSFVVDMQNYNGISKNNDHFTSEFVINETPIGARNLLTRGFIQDEISSVSGAAISTRGRYMGKNDHNKNPSDRPLYLFLQGPSKQSIDMAIQKIEEIIRNGVGSGIRQNYNRSNDTIQADTKLSGVMQGEKIFIGLDHISTFDLRNKIIGQGGSNFQYIRTETGAAVTLRGRGSQFIDPQLGHESPENMHLFIEHPQTDGLVAARQLAVNLIETLAQELQQVTSEQQAVSMSTPQLMNIPPRLIGIPPLTVPPPQQQFATVQQASQSIDQPVIINSSQSEMQGQVQLRNQQIQHNQQSVMIQQSPSLSRVPIVNIPPPGIHIPQHPGPMVPPPQIVQLSGPPPTAPSSGNVLVVAQPPPAQSMYLPSDLAASSVGTFSLLQGGVLYHQAPPIQTQAQIGDGLHIISAPPQATVDNINISMNSHAQPSMIITQVQLEANNQGDQISFQQPVVSQQQKSQFHVIGHVQNAISQETQQNDNFTHYTVSNQTSTPTSLVLTVPYHIPASNTTCTVTAIPVTQNQLQLDQSMKQIPRVLHTANFNQQDRQRNERATIAVQLSNTQIQTSQSSLEQMIMSQTLNNQPIVNTIQHVPINQIPPPQLQNNFISNQTNLLASQQNAQVLLSQDIANQLKPNQIMAQTHQVMSQDGINQQSINIQQSLQSQVQRHLQFNQSSYDHQPLRQDNWNRSNQGRIRKPLRNNRQYPWVKSQNDSPYSIKRDSERKHEDYGNDGRPKYQQSNDLSQLDDWKNQQHRDRNANNNQHNQRNYQQYDKIEASQIDNCNSWKRSEKSENYQDEDCGRKRKFDSDNNRNSRSDNNQTSSESGSGGHKSRYELEEKSDGFKQTKHKTSSNKVFSQNDQTKPDKDTTSKWLEQSGEGSRSGNFDKKLDDGGSNKHSDMCRNVDQCSNQTQTEPNLEKHNDQLSNNISELHKQQVTSWGEQRSDFKGNIQYVTAGQYHMQNINDDNTNMQQKYVNGPPMYQNNMPYLLPPPPPPPPRAQQHNVQFNMSQGSNTSHMPIVNSIPMSIPNIVSSMASHQNVPFDIISNVPQSNANQNITTSIPAVLTQNVQAHLLNQNVVANIAQSMHNIAPYITQSMSNTVPNIMVQNMTSSPMIVPNTTNTHSIPLSVSNISMSMPTVMGQIRVGPSMVPPPQTIIHGNAQQSISNMVPPPVLPANICSSRPQMTHSVSVPPTMSTQQPAYPYWMG